MNTPSLRSRWLTLLALAASLAFAPRPAMAAEADTAAVKAAAAQFYTALNTMFTGKLGPMLEVWSHSKDVTYMGPAGGFQTGWKQVRKMWEEQADMKLGGHVEPADMRITAGAEIAVTSNYEVGSNVDSNGKRSKVSIRATNIFRKEDGAWKMIGHHTDLIPGLGK